MAIPLPLADRAHQAPASGREDQQLGDVGFTPRTFQEIKTACSNLEVEIDAKLRALRSSRRRSSGDSQSRRTPTPSKCSAARKPPNKSPQRSHSAATLRDRLRRGAALRPEPEPRARRAPGPRRPLSAGAADSKPQRSASCSALHQKLDKMIAECRSFRSFYSNKPPKVATTTNSVATSLEHKLGKGPLRPDALAQFCEAREHPRAITPNADFVARNTQTARLPSPDPAKRAQRALMSGVRIDVARQRRLAAYEELLQKAEQDYLRRFFPQSSRSKATSISSSGDDELRFLTAALEGSQGREPREILLDLTDVLPGRMLGLFTSLFTPPQLARIFKGSIIENMIIASRIYSLAKRLIIWARSWKRKKAAELLVHFLQIPRILGAQAKIAIHRFLKRIRFVQATWRHFRWRLTSLCKRIYEHMWLPQESDILEELFTRCPGDHDLLVWDNELLCGEDFALVKAKRSPSKDLKARKSLSRLKTKTPSKQRPQSANARRRLGNKEMGQLLLDAFMRKLQQHQFRPEVAQRLLRRELLERLYLHAQRVPVGVKPWQLLPQVMNFGFPAVVLPSPEEMTEIIRAVHAGAGVRPRLARRCTGLLPCRSWRVTAARKLAADARRTLREGLRDHREGVDDRPKPLGEEEGQQDDTSSDDSAPPPEEGHAALHSAGSLPGVLLAANLHTPLYHARQLFRGGSDEGMSATAHSSVGPTKQSTDELFASDVKALLDVELPVDVEGFSIGGPSTHVGTNEAGWPSADALVAPTWPTLEVLLQEEDEE